ncbi:RagB/SusD family nutrient uptake outer membrane protein [Thermophagus sp. OGC60D27]|uniref:RagB/SusD family nutrient uptake outer membrane protein n=1 Tax=Thermophagus sp. OGC60D27 TaxID=3458415 RepID=UPI004037745B
MKKLKIFSILIVGLLFGACDDFLDLNPISDLGSGNFYKTNDEVEAAVISVYDGMQTFVQYEFALAEMRSDNTKTNLREGEWAQFESMNVDVSNATVAQYWMDNYKLVFLANTVLEHLDIVSDPDERAQFEGEAKFARAFAHFNLVRAFGDVPIIKTIVLPGDKDTGLRQPVEQVYTAIQEDLSDAIELLPNSENMPFGRAGKEAAQAMLAKVYLTIGDHAQAKTLLEEIITNGKFELMDDYHDVFYSEGNDEIIFAVPFIPDDSEESQIFSYDFTWKGRASGLNYPTLDLMSQVDPADARFNTLFYYDPQAISSGGYECGKFRSDASNEELSGNDWIVLRYADVLLMYVEASIGEGDSTSDALALEGFNAIRNRAGLSDDFSSVTKADLLKERRIELAFENHRLYDLVRFGEAESVMTAFSQTEEANFVFNANDLLLPIPQREINLNSGLKQNPGY